MSAVLLDTNIVSFVHRDDTRAELYRRHLEDNELLISFATVGEAYEGALLRGWGRERLAHLERTLRRYLVVPFSPSICREWGRVRAARRRRPISPNDAWIAATAIVHGCPLVTHDFAGFSDVPGLTVVTEREG